MRTTALTAGGFLGLALLSPTPVADAAGETCRGEAATAPPSARATTSSAQTRRRAPAA